jgi:hypothetical protein
MASAMGTPSALTAHADAAHADAAPATMRSKTLATWVAVLGGFFGLHRFYLRGLTDPWGWLHAAAAFLGLMGVQRVRSLGVDDPAAPFLLPLLGLSISAAMLAAIVYGLTSDERWAERHHQAIGVVPTAWGPVLGVILALTLGATALVATVAYVGQKFFEAILGV